ncbi:PRC-barrel domain-containing protein [Puniceibacterium sp. IMCC21224]|uniref:PRC-barrel domain-containing protein n=1 Tax=Puniceibacterium sp. IMCC21224 TaxID=1618204 RepID=UPI00065D1605|nr:PRC-barrel domain-containing protein [Puniceibacterium sp. IMCC21224]KMK65281.1 PRC-barrel protein [Puniceibacterium sp. IMCC21224]
MTLKNMMIGSAVAALVAGGAIAQETSTEAPAPLVPSAEVETQSDATTDGTEMGTGSDMTAETPVIPDADVEADTEMSTDMPVAPDAGTTLAPETGMAAETQPTLGDDMGADPLPNDVAELTVDQVLGMTVTGIDDETIGEIDYVVAQPDGPAFVIGVGGFLGLGEYTVAIPADQFSVTEDGYLKLASMTRSDIEAQPEFDESGVEGLEGDVVIGSLS